MNTSANMCRQGYKLTEPFLLEEVAQVIFLGGTDIDVSHNQGVLLGVDELPQMPGQLGEGLISRSVCAYYVQLLHADLGQLKVGLPILSDHASHPLFNVGDNSFSAATACKMSSITLQLVPLLLLFLPFQPGLLNKKDVALHQHRICSDVLNMFAKGAGVEGAHFQFGCFCILHPITGILIDRDSVHSPGFFNDLVVDSDLQRVQLFYNVELFYTLDSRQHYVGHARLVHAGDIHNQGTGFCNRLTLELSISKCFRVE